MSVLLASVTPAPSTKLGLGPLIDDPWWTLLVIIATYWTVLATSGHVVRRALNVPPPKPSEENEPPRLRAGRLIGKCENLLVVTLVLLEQFSALAIIFTAKSLARKEEIQKDPEFFLGGTLVNVVYSAMMALVARILLTGI